MKLIVSELEAFKRYVSREFYYVMMDLITKYNWKQIETYNLWMGPGTIMEKLLDEFGELPEVMLFWGGYEFLAAHSRFIYRLNCNKYIFSDDLHWSNEKMRQAKIVSFALCDTILSTYGYHWAHYYPQLSRHKKVVWIPHSASPDFLLPFNPRPDNSIFLAGAMSRHYPLRQQMKRLHTERSYPITYHDFPGYHCQYNYENDEDVGRSFAGKINKFRAGFTDSSKFKYVVAKYFEIPATGTLLLADDAVSEQLKKLGFIEMQHYISVSEDNLEERIRFVLDEQNHRELDEIRRRGQELILERHKTSDRARQINEICLA